MPQNQRREQKQVLLSTKSSNRNWIQLQNSWAWWYATTKIRAKWNSHLIWCNKISAMTQIHDRLKFEHKKIIIANKRSYKTKKLKNLCIFFVLWLKVAHNQHLYDKTMFCAILPQILVLEYSFTAKIFWFFFVIVNVGISHNNNKYGYIITTMAFILTIGIHTKLVGIRKKTTHSKWLALLLLQFRIFPDLHFI